MNIDSLTTKILLDQIQIVNTEFMYILTNCFFYITFQILNETKKDHIKFANILSNYLIESNYLELIHTDYTKLTKYNHEITLAFKCTDKFKTNYPFIIKKRKLISCSISSRDFLYNNFNLKSIL